MRYAGSGVTRRVCERCFAGKTVGGDRSGAQYLREDRVERTGRRELSRIRPVIFVCECLLIRRGMCSVPKRVREAHVLCEQQKRADEQQQRALGERWRTLRRKGR